VLVREAGARLGGSVAAIDREVDVRDRDEVERAFEALAPRLVFHLAAAKHAPEGELDPLEVSETNVTGTANVLAAADGCGARVILASSCKACDPETAYGASKLIAERMVLNAGGSVARFYNVPETCGNVFELWRGLPEDAPLPVSPCSRYFQSRESAIGLLLAVVDLPPGRYCVDPGAPRSMASVAADLYPGRPQETIEPRRGDRLAEPLCAVHERLFPAGNGLNRVVSQHDSAFALVAA